MESTRIALRVSPNARRSAVVGPYGTGWKVRVAEPPEGGRANAEVVRLLADVLGISAGHVRIVSGETSQNKLVQIDGLSRDAVHAALARAY